MGKCLKISLVVALIALIVASVYFVYRKKPLSERLSEEKGISGKAEIIAENLSIPWEIVFLPDGRILVSERGGMIRLLGPEPKIFNVESLNGLGEGGLLGMALHPDFETNQLIYLYFTTEAAGKRANRVARYRFEGNSIMQDKIILDNIPAAANHNGGRLAFGPHGFLYVTTGDAENSRQAQDVSSLAGKILRITDEGAVPDDNPFGNAVFAFGLRNPQGLAWDNQGRLWATDHGRSGVFSGFDELNLIEAGQNYGWPEIQGEEAAEGMKRPFLQSGSQTIWAPAGAAFLDGSIFFGGLRGEALYEADIDGDRLELKTHFKNEFGRIRAVISGPDGFLYISTSNRDGRGEPREGDDKIIKIDPSALN